MPRHEESWIVFRTLEPNPDGYKRADVGLLEHDAGPLRTRLTTLAIVTLRYPPDEDGLPSDDDRERLGEVEDAVVPVLEKNAGAVMAGRVLGEGSARLAFYADPARAGRVTAETLAPLAAGFGVGVEAVPDPDWRWFEENLLPTPPEERLRQDTVLIDVFEEHGDPLVTPRPVEHLALFPSEAEAQAFAAAAEAEGFATDCIEPAGADEDGDEPDAGAPVWEARVSRTQAIQLEDIFPATCLLSDLAEEHGGDYDGWQSVVVGPDGSIPEDPNQE